MLDNTGQPIDSTPQIRIPAGDVHLICPGEIVQHIRSNSTNARSNFGPTSWYRSMLPLPTLSVAVRSETFRSGCGAGSSTIYSPRTSLAGFPANTRQDLSFPSVIHCWRDAPLATPLPHGQPAAPAVLYRRSPFLYLRMVLQFIARHLDAPPKS